MWTGYHVDLNSFTPLGAKRLVDENLLSRYCLLDGRDLSRPAGGKDLVRERESEIPQKVSCSFRWDGLLCHRTGAIQERAGLCNT